MPEPSLPEPVLQAAAHLRLARARGANVADPWRGLTGFRNGAAAQAEVQVQTRETSLRVRLEPAIPTLSAAVIGADEVVFRDGQAYGFVEPRVIGSLDGAVAGGGVLSPMPGKVVSVLVAAGDLAIKGQPLVTVEAMKMEHTLTAGFDGVVAEVLVAAGDQVSEGQTLVRLEQQKV